MTINQLLANSGVQLRKFLETGQRGALIANADIRMRLGKDVVHPVFDYITFDQARDSWDRIFQESIACYDPAQKVVVFEAV